MKILPEPAIACTVTFVNIPCPFRSTAGKYIVLKAEEKDAKNNKESTKPSRK